MGERINKNGQLMNAFDAALDAGALFEVSYDGVALPNGIVPVHEKGVYQGQPLHLQVWRPDTGQRLGLHSGKYPITSYSHLVKEIEELFPNSTSGVTVFGHGERLAITQELGEAVDLGGGDTIRPNLLWVTSHDGTWATTGMHLMHRAFCTNQMPFATKFIKVRKTRNHDALLSDRVQILAEAIRQQELITKLAVYLREQEMVDAEFRRMVATLLPAPEENAPTVQHNKHAARQVAVMNHWRLENQGPSAGTKWAAYSALQAADYHDLPVVNARGLRTAADRIERSTVALVERNMRLSDRFLELVGA